MNTFLKILNMKNHSPVFIFLLLTAMSFLSAGCTSGNELTKNGSQFPDTAGFPDSAHHWYVRSRGEFLSPVMLYQKEVLNN